MQKYCPADDIDFKFGGRMPSDANYYLVTDVEADRAELLGLLRECLVAFKSVERIGITLTSDGIPMVKRIAAKLEKQP